MSEFKSNFPLYQLILDEVPLGDGQLIYNWRNNTYQNWENKHASKCSPLHIRCISFMWKQSTNVNLGDLPEFTFVFNTNSFNERANTKLFANDKIANSEYSLNDLRLIANDGPRDDDSVSTPVQDPVTGTHVGIRSKDGTITNASAELVEEAVLLTIAELAGSRDIAMRFVSSFSDPIKTFDDYFNPRVQVRLREALEKVYTIMQTITPTRYLNYVLKGGEFMNF